MVQYRDVAVDRLVTGHQCKSYSRYHPVCLFKSPALKQLRIEERWRLPSVNHTATRHGSARPSAQVALKNGLFQFLQMDLMTSYTVSTL
jgi:hypothetical protein